VSSQPRAGSAQRASIRCTRVHDPGPWWNGAAGRRAV